MKNKLIQFYNKSWCLLACGAALVIFDFEARAKDIQPQEINIPMIVQKNLKSFEPSAVIYLEQTNSFLIAIDDTDKRKSAMLFMIDSKGLVKQDPVLIEGIDAMTDMESLFSDGKYIYILSSQSRNKKGKEMRERNLFVRGTFDGKSIKAHDVIELRPLLLEAFLQSQDPRIAKHLDKLGELLETEASFVQAGRLYIGLKDPQPNSGVALVLDLGNIDQIFHDQKLDPGSVKVAYEIVLGKGNKLSDMIVAGDRFILASTRETGDGGSIWSYNQTSGSLNQLQAFSVARPEGLAIGKNPDELFVVFDQGESKALFMNLQL